MISATLFSCGNPASTGAAAKPPAPLSIRAVGSSLSGICVTWVRVLDVTSYNVYRGSTSDTGASVFVKKVAADTFFDTGLVAGAYYYYEVSCINSLGESPKSSAVGSTTGFPGNVAAKGVSASGISVTWNPVAGAALYNAYRSESDTGAFLAVGLVANDTFVDTGLSAGKVYYYEVSATGGSQESPLSGAVWGITIAAAPFGLKIDSVFAKTARIVWQADTGASSYTVYRRPNDTAAFAAVGVSASDTFTDTGLSPATRYSYAVSAVNLSGESQKSAPAGLLTIPAAPQIAVDSALSSSSVLVLWNAVTGATAYRVYRRDSTTTAFALAGAAASDTFFVDTGLSTGMKYFHEVTALDSSGESAPSAVDSVTTP